MRRLEDEVFRQKKDYNMLQEEKRQALEELLQLKKLHSQQQASSLEQSQKIRELHQELDAKEELVKRDKNIKPKDCYKIRQWLWSVGSEWNLSIMNHL